jgi:hypothetical protein
MIVFAAWLESGGQLVLPLGDSPSTLNTFT